MKMTQKRRESYDHPHHHIDVHHRYPKPNNLQIANPSRRSLLQPKQTVMRESERRGSPGRDEREIGVARLRRCLRVASLAPLLPHGGLYSPLHCLLCHASHID
uniref:Uncharacterized protein n=1 Tax=Fagus sylvatica TaxID=28930 RepID=A0A2N9F7Q5_FAGSY